MYEEEKDGIPGLRTPQLGATHAVLGYWTTRRFSPATVVMPTGTGKTETMVALLVAAQIPRLLVLVPSDALRDQVARKFEKLGVLQEFGVIAPSAMRPVVGRVEHKFASVEDSVSFAQACNVIVATPQVLSVEDEATKALARECTHLFVDEAHHVAAKTWTDLRQLFDAKHVVQFTATPFREDGRHLQGRVIYSFPLGRAQEQGYFSEIDYFSVVDFEDTDRAVAMKSVARLREDLASGLDHILMARVAYVKRIEDVKQLYDDIARDLQPVAIYHGMGKRRAAEGLAALRERRSRVVVCVNMLGEGFDMPALKVAAVHDPQKSLGVTLQFIGRFTRATSGSTHGTASVFVARKEIESDRRLRTLFAEDSDWNLVLRDLTESVVEEQQAVSDFEEGFTSLPEEVALRTLAPKLSTVVYRSATNSWIPENINDYFGEEALYTEHIGLNLEAGVAWCVVERKSEVRWGDVRSIEDTSYELYVLYFDERSKLLYINNSANEGVFEGLAEAVLGDGATRFTGSTVYRVMADITRLVPTNVGVLDARDQFRRFSMHVGPDVTASFSQAEAGTKSQTNISGGGYRDGERVNISASLKGRIWSAATARSLKHWKDWCDTIGKKLLDETISIDSVVGHFILPQPLDRVPQGVLLAVEWPWSVHAAQTDNFRLSVDDTTYEATHVDLVPITDPLKSSFRFLVRSSAWTIEYEATIDNGQIRYRPSGGREVRALRPRSDKPLSEWFNENGLLFVLDHDRVIQGDLLYRPTWQNDPYDRASLTIVDWTGTDITVESQRAERRSDSIQYRTIRELQTGPDAWDVILDDDGSGEVADVVAIRVDPEGLLIKLVHCKFSGAPSPGARIKDLYEVCGQAQKSVMWRRSDLEPLFGALDERARKKYGREGVSPFEVGNIDTLYRIRTQAMSLRRRVEIVVVQPGLSAARASGQQLDLLASTEAYLRTTIGAPLEVWCSS